jgi:origin recognition complex subunit 1
MSGLAIGGARTGPSRRRRADADDDDDDESEDDDEEEGDDDDNDDDDDERWGSKKQGKKAAKAKRRARAGAGAKAEALVDSRFVSRHVKKDHRAGVAASGDTRVMGLGAMGVRREVRPTPLTALGRARQALALDNEPGRLPCRESEHDTILKFVESSINAGGFCAGQRVLYISGVPGTGKTATVREVIRSLRAKSRAGHLPPFNHVDINGLKLQSPAHAYCAIAEDLMGERMSHKHAQLVLDRRFKEGKGADGRVTVLVLDEMDLLVTRTQTLLYNLFEWPTHTASRLVILGIANTLDLPERLLPKILSRLGANRVTFNPYSADQLKTIVHARLAGAGTDAAPGAKDTFEATAIEMASRKIAAVSGDARRVLELCRRGAELLEARIAARKAEEKLQSDPVAKAGGGRAGVGATKLGGAGGSFGASSSAAAARHPAPPRDLVTMKDIQTAQGEMFQTPYMRLIEAASRYARIFLAALVLHTRRSGVPDASTADVMRAVEQLCRTHSRAGYALIVFFKRLLQASSSSVFLKPTVTFASKRYRVCITLAPLLVDEDLPPAGAGPRIACQLASQRLILAGPGSQRCNQRVQLNVPVADVVYALKVWPCARRDPDCFRPRSLPHHDPTPACPTLLPMVCPPPHPSP